MEAVTDEAAGLSRVHMTEQWSEAMIEILDPAMRRIAPDDPKVELIQGGFQFLEGPVWDSRRGALIFSDIPANTMYEYRPGAGVSVFRQPSRHTNGNTLDGRGRLLSCEHSGRQVTRTEADGAVTPLATHFEGKRLNSPNDIVVRGDGTIVFTDPPYGIQSERMGMPAAQELDFHGVYRLDADGTLSLLVDDFERPNGLAFSPDQTLLYIDDTARAHIRVFTVTAEGRLAGDRVFAELNAPEEGRPDGMKVDREGNVYCTGPGGAWVFNPLGALLGKIVMPERTANLAWGDGDWQSLYLTASTSLYRLRLGVAGIPTG
jgi:gluconolactonase